MDLREKVARAIRDFDDPGAEIAHQFAQAAIDTVFAELRAAMHKRKDIYLMKASRQEPFARPDLNRHELFTEKAEVIDYVLGDLAILDAAQKGE